MTVWQYAQLTVTYDNSLAAGGGRWTIAWHGPDASTQDTAEAYDHVVGKLNRAGTEGWELVDVSALAAESSGHPSDKRDWSLTRYSFRRPSEPAAAESTERTATTAGLHGTESVARGPGATSPRGACRHGKARAQCQCLLDTSRGTALDPRHRPRRGRRNRSARSKRIDPDHGRTRTSRLLTATEATAEARAPEPCRHPDDRLIRWRDSAAAPGDDCQDHLNNPSDMSLIGR
jgi:hypothetical protein